MYKIAMGGGLVMLGIDQEGAVMSEEERLKRRIIHLQRFSDRWRQISILYRLADSYGSRVFARSLCHARISSHQGCITGECCQCRPNVFAHEKKVLDLLPKRMDDSLFCPFFNLTKRTCGIYAVRPFACRIFYNEKQSSHYCQNPSTASIDFFEALKRHVEKILGPHQGGYLPE